MEPAGADCCPGERASWVSALRSNASAARGELAGGDSSRTVSRSERWRSPLVSSVHLSCARMPRSNQSHTFFARQRAAEKTSLFESVFP